MSRDVAGGLLDDYAARARNRGVGAEIMALRTESEDMRAILCHAASGGAHDLQDIKAAIADGRQLSLDPVWAASLGRVLALQNIQGDDRSAGMGILRSYAVAADQGAMRFRRLYVELLIQDGQYEEARRYLDGQPDIRRLYHDYLYTEIHNPFIGSPFADERQWLRKFNSPFRGKKLEQIRVTGDGDKPFDRLACTPGRDVDGPLISVILTSFRPEREPLLTAVRSILSQTWRNLELIVVDDASPQEFVPLLEEVESLDARVTVVRLLKNGGTYLARNVGWSRAIGEFITGQDADDWSHPERLERQIEPLLLDADLPGTRAHAISVSEELVRVRPGYLPLAPHAPSLLIRRSWARSLGGYLPARKAADNELHHRLDAIAPKPVLDLKLPLSIYRVLPDSLSRGDFRAGWSHPARRAFRDAYMHWHATAPADELRVDPGRAAPIPIPRRFQVAPTPQPQFDVVLAGDWRQSGGPQKSMLEEIRALRRANYSVGVLHMEAARFMTVAPGRLIPAVQDLINRGEVSQVLLDDDVRIRLLILRYPPILQFVPKQASRLSVESLVILANQAPSERDGTDRRYVVQDCTNNAQRLFGIAPLWVPQGPVVRHALEHDAPDTVLATFDIPAIVDLDEWATHRLGVRSDVPVVGRHSRDNPMKWPEDPRTLELVYPTSGDMDVRVMGGAGTPIETLGLKAQPPGWVVFDTDEMPVRTFLSSLDYFVYYQHSQAFDAFGRAILEAIAAGCVVILPHEFAPTFGEAATYADPEDVAAVIWTYYSAPKLHEEQVRKGYAKVRQEFSYESYVSLVRDRLLESNWSNRRAFAEEETKFV